LLIGPHLLLKAQVPGCREQADRKWYLCGTSKTAYLHDSNISTMPAKNPSVATQRYHAVVIAVLDFQIERLSGQFVCDGRDAIREHFTRQQAQADGSLEKRRLSALKALLKATLKVVRPDFQAALAEQVMKKTGHVLEDFPEWGGRMNYDEISARGRGTKGYSEVRKIIQPDGSSVTRVSVMTGPKPDRLEEQEAVSPDGRMRVMVTQYRMREHASTSVTLITPVASGPVYSVFEIRPDIRATWIDNHTLRVDMNKIDPVNVCYHEIRSLGDTIHVEYHQDEI